MKNIILLSLLTLLTVSCSKTSSKIERDETDTVELISETQKFGMFCAALENHSTAPNYIVVTVKNLNTGEIKEICTEAPLIRGAIGRQTGKSPYSIDENGNFICSFDCNNYPNRYFEFSADSALWNISFDLYTISELEEYAKSIDIKKIIEKVKSGELKSIRFVYDEEEQIREEQTLKGTTKEQRMFAHLMFNNGIMITRGCMIGNICSLYPYDEIKP